MASVSYPAKFIFLASMNPCPCGHMGDTQHECTCTPQQISRYLAKVSGPLLDRIDIHMEVSPVKYDDISSTEDTESSETIRKRVNIARNIQFTRLKESGLTCNGQLNNRQIKKYCTLSIECEKILKRAFHQYKFSARTYHKVLKVSRTIADLDQSVSIEPQHLLEAIRYRSIDSQYWGR